MTRERVVAIACAFLCTLAAGRARGAACGSSGNTYWSFATATAQTNVTSGQDGLYLASGSRLSRLSPVTGAESDFRIFAGVTLRRPTCFALPSYRGVFVTGNNGYVYSLTSTNLAPNWSRSLQRIGYTSDETSLAPAVVQKRSSSNAAYQAARTEDLVMIGTSYPGTTTANRIYGLNMANGNLVWIFNPTGASLMDAVHGVALDQARNSLYVTSDKQGPSAQNTIWALSTINGAKKWGRDLGAVDAEPVLAEGRLYVATREGELYALDPDTGATLWQTTVTTTVQLERLAANTASGQVAVYVVDSGGTLHAYADPCSGFVALWNFTPPAGGKVSAAPAFLGGFLYAGADDGKIWQVRASDGQGPAFATVSAVGSAPSFDPLVIEEEGAAMLIAHSGGYVKRICVPWPHTAGDKAFRFEPDDAVPSMLLGCAITRSVRSYP